jgi:hypothetical protein
MSHDHCTRAANLPHMIRNVVAGRRLRRAMDFQVTLPAPPVKLYRKRYEKKC